MSPQLRHLRYFVAVAEERSFTKAAQRLSVAQQAVSATIRQLELELGVPLLTRSTRRVELTESGEMLLERGRVALESFDRAWKAVKRPADVTVSLSVAYDPLVSRTFVTAVHGLLVERTPHLHASWRPRYSAELTAEVKAGRFDAGVAIAPELSEGLEYEVIGRQPLKVIVGKRHPLASSHAIAVDALHEARIFVLPRDLAPRFYDAIVRVWDDAETHPEFADTPDPGGSATCEEYERLAACGLATAWAVDEFVERHREEVVAVELDTTVELPVTVLWRADAPERRLLSCFVEVCRNLADLRRAAEGLPEALADDG